MTYNFNTNNNISKNALVKMRVRYFHYKYHWNLKFFDSKIFEGRVGRLNWPIVEIIFFVTT